MKYTEIERDLFTMPNDYSLAHCIAKDAVMGAGIALEFTKRFPDLKSSTKDEIARNLLPVTSVVDYTDEKTGRLIINLITKSKSYHKPTRKDFNETISCLKRYVDHYNIKKIAIPQIGSGLDKLNWRVTSRKIKEIFRDSDVEIVVCIWR